MKVELFVDTETYSHIEWPVEVPLPNAGDEVLLQLPESGALFFIVEKRFFGIGTGIDGKPSAQVRIQGRAEIKPD